MNGMVQLADCSFEVPSLVPGAGPLDVALCIRPILGHSDTSTSTLTCPTDLTGATQWVLVRRTEILLSQVPVHAVTDLVWPRRPLGRNPRSPKRLADELRPNVRATHAPRRGPTHTGRSWAGASGSPAHRSPPGARRDECRTSLLPCSSRRRSGAARRLLPSEHSGTLKAHVRCDMAARWSERPSGQYALPRTADD